MADDSPKKKPRASTRLRRDPVADQSAWRTKFRATQIKFDDIQKTIFLEAMLEHGRKMLAAKKADVSLETVNRHLENDEEFAKLYDQVVEERAGRIVEQLEREALEGFTQPIFDKDGNEIGEKRIYESGLRAMLLKRFDDAYRDRQEIDLKGSGGVLVVPADISPQDWIAQQLEKNKSSEPPPKILPSGAVEGEG